MGELTLEQALQNIEIVLDNFVGKKADHIILAQSLQLIKDSTCNCKKVEDKA